MTDYTELRRLAQLAKDAPFDAPDTDAIPDAWEAVASFQETFDPEMVLTLIDELEVANSALRVIRRHASYDGRSMREETIANLCDAALATGKEE